MNFQQKAKFLPVAALVCAGMLLAPAHQAQANLLTNGSFETPNIGLASYHQDLTAGSTYVTGWTGGAGGVEVQSNGLLSPTANAYNGTQYVELETESPSSISQNFATVAGQKYKLTFVYAARPTSGTNTATVNFGTTTGTATATASGAGISWVPYSFYYTAAATGTSTVTFTAATTGKPTFGSFLDDVNVVATPEPETWAMMGLGLAAVAFMGWKRRKNNVGQAVVPAGLAI